MSVETTSIAKLEKILAAAQLPALPQSAMRVLELSRDESNGPPEYAAALEGDPGLTAQVLKFVNSSYFGFAHEIKSVRQAIALVGVRTMKNFVLWNAVFSLVPNPKNGEFDVKRLWQDSLRRAVLARQVGQFLKLRESEDLFAAALLQDMALPILAKEMPSEYGELFRARTATGERLSILEFNQFGWTHATAGVMLALIWKLPRDMVELIANHVMGAERAAEASPAVRCIVLSSLLPASVDRDWRDLPAFESLYRQLGGTQPLEALLADTDRGFAEFAPVLKLTNLGASLQDRWREAASPAEVS